MLFGTPQLIGSDTRDETYRSGFTEYRRTVSVLWYFQQADTPDAAIAPSVPAGYGIYRITPELVTPSGKGKYWRIIAEYRTNPAWTTDGPTPTAEGTGTQAPNTPTPSPTPTLPSPTPTPTPTTAGTGTGTPTPTAPGTGTGTPTPTPTIPGTGTGTPTPTPTMSITQGWEISDCGTLGARGKYCWYGTSDDRPAYRYIPDPEHVYILFYWAVQGAWIIYLNGLYGTLYYVYSTASEPPTTGWNYFHGFSPAPTLTEVECLATPTPTTPGTGTGTPTPSPTAEGTGTQEPNTPTPSPTPTPAGGTTVYKANSTDCAAYYGYEYISPYTNVNSALTSFNSAITGTDLTNISTDDANYHIYSSMSGNTGQRIKIKIAESVASITNIKLTVKGYGGFGMSPPTTFSGYGWVLFVYDDTGGHWDPYLVADDSSSSKATLSYDITSNFADFIDSNGYLNFCVHTRPPSGIQAMSFLYYAECAVTYG